MTDAWYEFQIPNSEFQIARNTFLRLRSHTHTAGDNDDVAYTPPLRGCARRTRDRSGLDVRPPVRTERRPPQHEKGRLDPLHGRRARDQVLAPRSDQQG